MGKKKKKQAKINKNPPFSKQLRIAQNNALVAQKKKEKLNQVLEQELKGKDPSTAAILSEVFGKEIALVENQITKYCKLCTELNIKISKQQGKKQKQQQKHNPTVAVALELSANSATAKQPEAAKGKKKLKNKQLKNRLRTRFKEIWRAMKSNGQTEKGPPLPNDMQIPASDMDKSLIFWTNLVASKLKRENKLKSRRSLRNRHPMQTRSRQLREERTPKPTAQQQNVKQGQQPHLLSQICNAIAGGKKKLIKEDGCDSVETSQVVFHKRCTNKRKAPILIDISDDDDDVIPKKCIKKEPEDPIADSLFGTDAQPKFNADQKMKKEQEPEDCFPSPNTQWPHNRPTVPAQANGGSNDNTFQQGSLIQTQQSTGQMMPGTWRRIMNDRGVVLDLSIDHAVVQTQRLGVLCPLSKWIENNGTGQTTSLLNVMNNADPVVVTAARNARKRPWNVIIFGKAA